MMISTSEASFYPCIFLLASLSSTEICLYKIMRLFVLKMKICDGVLCMCKLLNIHLLSYMYMALYVSHDGLLFILIPSNSPEVVSLCRSCILQNETGVITYTLVLFPVCFWHCTHLVFNFKRCWWSRNTEDVFWLQLQLLSVCCRGPQCSIRVSKSSSSYNSR